MNPLKTALKAALPCLVAAMVLTGCWDRREINDISFVLASGVDWRDGQYVVSAQFPLVGQIGGTKGGGGGTGGGDKTWYLSVGEGSTIWGASFKQQLSLSRVLNYAHRRVLLIGEGLAKHGVDSFLDLVTRDPQSRMSTLMLVTRGEARDALDLSVAVERMPAEMIREMALKAMNRPIMMKHFIDTLLDDGIDPVAPLLTITPSESGPDGDARRNFKLDGLAIFRDNKLVGMIDQSEADGVLWAMNQARLPQLAVKPPDGSEGLIVVQFNEYKVQIVPTIREDLITMRLDISGRGNIVETTSTFEIADSPKMDQLTDTVERELEKTIASSIRKLQTEFNADPIGFGEIIEQRDPRYWKTIKSRWREIYPKVKFSVHTDILMENVGFTTNPIGKTERRLAE